MRDNITDLNNFKREKEIKKEQEEELKKNEELFKEITGKNTIFLTLDEMYAYQEIGIVCTFSVKNTYSMCIAVFRNQMYVLNHIGGKFEFLGRLEDVIGKGIFGE